MAEPTPWYAAQSPEIGQAFQTFYQACQSQGVLETKTKVLLIAAVEGAGTQLYWARSTFAKHLAADGS